jgi:hypothetical protein
VSFLCFKEGVKRKMRAHFAVSGFGKAGLAAQGNQRTCGAGPSTSLRFAQDNIGGGMRTLHQH